MKMKKKVTIRVKSGGAFQLPLYQDEIKRLLKLRKTPGSIGMFDVNSLVSDETDINTQIWVDLKEVDCIIVEPLTNVTIPQDERVWSPPGA